MGQERLQDGVVAGGEGEVGLRARRAVRGPVLGRVHPVGGEQQHQALRRPHQSARTTVLLEADTLDVRRVYCTDCRGWCDLQADAEEADRTLGPWPGGAEWRRSVRSPGA